MEKKRIVVIGNGMVGHRFIDELSQKNSDIQFDDAPYEIMTFSEEPRLAYDRVQLSSFFSGKDADDLMLTSENEYKEKGITYFLNEKVVSIQRENKLVVTDQGREIAYDSLVLATGSYPFVPPIPGNEQPHCHVYRTIEDLEAIRASGDSSEIGVVIGGGLLGLEAANAIQNMGLETHVVEFAPRLMAVQLDEGGGELLKQKITALGVNVHTEKATQSITKGDTCRYKLSFADGTELETDMVVFSAGIRPQDELAKAHDLTLGERGGIVINNQCQTNDSDIYAIGECALWEGKIFGLVAPGYQMAKVAVASICGTEAEFKGADMSTKLKLLGVDVASIGDAQGSTPGAQSYTFSDGIEQVYKRIIVSEDGKTLLGAVLVGDVESYPNLLQTMLNGLPLPEFPSVLLLSNDAADSDAGSAGLATLPDEAQICSCYDVTKGCIKTAVVSGCTTMADLKAETKASTGCGGCAALTKQVMDAELAALGHEVNNNLCEHFEYTRQELADIVRIKKIKTFDELLDSHGKGLGCDVCKPTVGSILASFWNDYVLKNEHMGLQDTNDIYLGNMQKDGTYSVVPRVAGGEITPDKLIVLGQVAKDYNLYTKVTGGQRIDLFGAQLHELPEIWKILVDAGFETGHAYGKSVRTVKSCVGSTWCRYGVDDSVGFAINIEDRYKGLRSPHKLKFAVSGCTRECAEAQSKDIGIIATENGWNLYVCGNGGMRPRHADLFASDLDRETLIKYIDRILMFYIRTADRLQRTSVWLENLEGGLDYLKQVVIEDKLAIGEELEAEMAASLGQYQCEWKTTIESPEKLKRFQHFINSDQADSGLKYITERGQRVPAPTVQILEPTKVAAEPEKRIDVVEIEG
ncbi:nitrite reductase large subunit [Enterovibrio norvegicus]|uniref:nitrite reductase large subunit NirB n=1 Tax=Enterovibrio norvegicus TaxID=188144 RepID=UPI000C8314BE|nr:nitrite reductase large subunit NirB [Enterovibrio norvegicus]MCC4797389.1 nitrite reductase large subunit NirB [Enterovibrio norvegicus]PMI27105.1 nitrite reductase large subunit [Enterovibrio norvegicus]PMI32882.1 nitrite reductase large subunit [Enterovibrio norvegicus]PMN56019.1 nitrite reductase large subunit [Enterovibrio norvegicus]TKF15332.1 nitrite reductase large subunit [Enterovibrio norvegicus]